MSNSNKNYELVDCEALATSLAEEAWEQEVKSKGLTIDQLYESVVTGDTVERMVKPEWAYNFFNLRDAYLELINLHKKEEPCTLPEKERT